MRLNRITYLLILASVLSLLINKGFSQDFKADLAAMLKAYAGLSNFRTEIEIRVFEAADSTEPLLIKYATINKQGDNYLYTIDELTTLSNDRYLLLINSNAKNIVYRRKSKEELKFLKAYEFVSPNLDSLLKSTDAIEFVGLEQSGKHYVISSPRSIIQKTHLYLDAKTYFIRRITYLYSAEKLPQNNKVVILYKSIDISPEFASDTFSERHYFIQEGSEVTPTPQFKEYKIIKSEYARR